MDGKREFAGRESVYAFSLAPATRIDRAATRSQDRQLPCKMIQAWGYSILANRRRGSPEFSDSGVMPGWFHTNTLWRSRPKAWQRIDPRFVRIRQKPASQVQLAILKCEFLTSKLPIIAASRKKLLNSLQSPTKTIILETVENPPVALPPVLLP
jgi:hypothetical protein